MKAVLAFAGLATALLLIFSGCVEERPITSLQFSSMSCDESIGYYPDNEVKEFVWWDDGSLEVTGYVTVNCFQSIPGGDYEKQGNKLILKYNVRGEPLADCICARELKYKFTNLDEEEYSFELKAVTDYSDCKNEGEGIDAIEEAPGCCQGLNFILPMGTEGTGIMGYCTAKCGKGTCDEIENAQNCPDDCKISDVMDAIEDAIKKKLGE